VQCSSAENTQWKCVYRLIMMRRQQPSTMMLGLQTCLASLTTLSCPQLHLQGLPPSTLAYDHKRFIEKLALLSCQLYHFFLPTCLWFTRVLVETLVH